jgi:hypothetical protein
MIYIAGNIQAIQNLIEYGIPQNTLTTDAVLVEADDIRRRAMRICWLASPSYSSQNLRPEYRCKTCLFPSSNELPIQILQRIGLHGQATCEKIKRTALGIQKGTPLLRLTKSVPVEVARIDEVFRNVAITPR